MPVNGPEVSVRVLNGLWKGPIRQRYDRKKESEKTESCEENVGNVIQSKGPQRQKQTKEQKKKRSGQARLVYVRHKP